MKVAAIIPVYNEGERILAVTVAAQGSPSVHEVIVVNDGLKDAIFAYFRSEVHLNINIAITKL